MNRGNAGQNDRDCPRRMFILANSHPVFDIFPVNVLKKGIGILDLFPVLWYSVLKRLPLFPFIIYVDCLVSDPAVTLKCSRKDGLQNNRKNDIRGWMLICVMDAKTAEEYYYSARRKYYDAKSDYQYYRSKENDYRQQQSAANRSLSDYQSQKLNFEKRLEGIVRIIAMLESSGNVSAAIDSATKAAQTADQSYANCVRLSGQEPASLTQAFSPKQVTAEQHSSAALANYKSEKVRLEEAIRNVNAQIAACASLIGSLNSKIKSCQSQQASLKRVITQTSLQMDRYKGIMNRG